MREIIFRGKPTASVLNEEDLQDCMFDIVDGFVYGNLIADEHEPTIVGKVIDSDWDYCSMEWWCPVVKETVGQFTGLHDATKWEDLTDAERDEWIKSGHTKEEWKGRRIFEGDIIEVDFDNDGPTIGKQKAFIEYSQHHTAFMVRPIKDWAFCEMTEGVVIGNIHDNPDLMKEIIK